MDSKQIWPIVGISLVMALVVSIATISVTGAATWPWQQPQKASIQAINVRANSCDADSVCEINSASLKMNNIFSNGSLVLDPTENLVINSNGVVLYDNNRDNKLNIQRDFDSGKRWLIQSGWLKLLGLDGLELETNRGAITVKSLMKLTDGLNVDEGDSSFEGRVILPRLVGNETGNAYLCIDSNGVIFRSLSPCR